jgi:1-phosphofructokinase family hexose kinase
VILSVTLNPCIDHAVFVDRLVTGDVNRVLRTDTDAGGKGVNLSRVAVELGAASVATGFLGGPTGRFVRTVLDDQGVHHDFVEVAQQTRINFSIEDRQGGPPTHLNPPGPEIGPIEWRRLLDTVGRYAKKARWVAVCGSMPPGVPPDAYAQILRVASLAGAQTVLDADGPAMVAGMEAKPNFIKPNASEAARLTGHEVGTLDQAIQAAQELYARLGDPEPGQARIVAVSRGKDGAVCCSHEGLYVGRSPQVEPKSTVGSGDSMIGGMLASLLRGEPVAKALVWGLAAGAATATTDGTKIGRRQVVELLYDDAQVDRL